MTINKCDRCGKCYEDHNIRHENGVRIVATNVRGEQYLLIKHMDLCKECMDMLKNFLNIDSLDVKAKMGGKR